METIEAIVAQEMIEHQFNKKLITKQVKKFLIEEHNSYINKGISLLNSWLNKTYYESKNKRLQLVKQLNVKELVIDVFAELIHCKTPELFTSVSAQLAGIFDWSDKPDAIKTAGEIIAVLCETDFYDICKNEHNSLVVVSRIKLNKQLEMFVNNLMYMPPMVVKPLKLKENTDSGYLTLKSSLILGRNNFHADNICLDALNVANGVELTLNKEFISKLELDPTFEIKLPEQQEQWDKFKVRTYQIMRLLAKNESFWLTHAYDKRGRMYARGYHINSQGFSYQKAVIEFKQQEVVEVPDEYRA